nr:hypothetical protein GCM10020241_21960 [Streptoalloteichus tenebrarius]
MARPRMGSSGAGGVPPSAPSWGTEGRPPIGGAASGAAVGTDTAGGMGAAAGTGAAAAAGAGGTDAGGTATPGAGPALVVPHPSHVVVCGDRGVPQRAQTMTYSRIRVRGNARKS